MLNWGVGQYDREGTHRPRPARRIRSEPMRTTMLFLTLLCIVPTPTQVAVSPATGLSGRFEATDEAGSPAALILVFSLSATADSPEHDAVAIREESL